MTILTKVIMTKEELASEIVVKLGWEDDGSAEANDLRSAFLAGYEAAEKKQGWVSVDERTPDFDGRYLCFIEAPQECGNIWRFQETVDLHYNEWITSEDQYVTHWRPLPPNP